MAPFIQKNAPVIKKTGGADFIKQPGRIGSSSETRRADSDNFLLDDIFHNLLAVADIISKIFAPCFIGQNMPETVAGNLMPRLCALPHNVRMLLRRPAKPEHCCLYLVFIHNDENPFHIAR